MIVPVKGSLLILLLSVTTLAASGISNAHASAQASASASAYSQGNVYGLSGHQGGVPLHGAHKETRSYGSVDTAMPQGSAATKGGRTNNKIRPDCSKCANDDSKWERDEYYEENEEKNEEEEENEEEVDDCNDDGQYKPHRHRGGHKSTNGKEGGSHNPPGVQKVVNNQPNPATGGLSGAGNSGNTGQQFGQDTSNWNNPPTDSGNSQQPNSGWNHPAYGASSGINNAITSKPSNWNANAGPTSAGNSGVTTKPVSSWTSPSWSQGVAGSTPSTSPQSQSGIYQQPSTSWNAGNGGASAPQFGNPVGNDNKRPCSSSSGCESKPKCNQAQGSNCRNNGPVKIAISDVQATANPSNVAGGNTGNLYLLGTGTGATSDSASGGASAGPKPSYSSSVPTNQPSAFPNSGSTVPGKCSSGSGCSSGVPQKVTGYLGTPGFGIGSNAQIPSQLGGYSRHPPTPNTVLDGSTHQWNTANPFLHSGNANIGPSQSGNAATPGSGTTVGTIATTSKPIGVENPFFGTGGNAWTSSNKVPAVGGHGYDQSKDTDTKSGDGLYNKPIGAGNPFFTDGIGGIKGTSGAQSISNTISSQGVQAIPSEPITTKPIGQGNPFFSGTLNVPANQGSGSGTSGTSSDSQRPILGQHPATISSHPATSYPGVGTPGIAPGHPATGYPGLGASGITPSHPATSYPGAVSGRPTTGYPGSGAPGAAPVHPAISYPGAGTPGAVSGRPTTGYPGLGPSGTAPAHPATGYPGSKVPGSGTPIPGYSAVGISEDNTISNRPTSGYPGTAIPQGYPGSASIAGGAGASGSANQGIKGHPRVQGIPTVLPGNANTGNIGATGSGIGTFTGNSIPSYSGNAAEPNGAVGSVAHAGAQSFAGAQAGGFSGSYSGSQASSSSYANAKSATYMSHGDPTDVFQQNKNWPFRSDGSNNEGKSWSSSNASSGASAYASSSAHSCAGIVPVNG